MAGSGSIAAPFRISARPDSSTAERRGETGGLAQRGRPNGSLPEPGPKRDPRLRLGQGLPVCVVRVQVPERLGMRKRGRIQPQHVDPFQEQAHAQPVAGQLLLDRRQQIGAVDGAEVVNVTVGDRHRHVVFATRCRQRQHQVGVQERQVGARDEHGRTAARHRPQPGGDALQRAAIGRPIDGTLDARQRRQLLPVGVHDHDRIGDALQDPGDAPHQRAAVPVEQRLGRAHPASTARRRARSLPAAGAACSRHLRPSVQHRRLAPAVAPDSTNSDNFRGPKTTIFVAERPFDCRNSCNTGARRGCCTRAQPAAFRWLRRSTRASPTRRVTPCESSASSSACA